MTSSGTNTLYCHSIKTSPPGPLMDPSSDARARLEKVERTIDRQKEYIQRVPDPDNRARAEDHLIMLVQERNTLLHRLASTDSAVGAGAADESNRSSDLEPEAIVRL
jgi:hypothetical protein